MAFVVALRNFESKSAALADQAAAQSTSPPLRAAATTLARHANQVAAGLWALLDRWQVPGLERLPVETTGPSSGIQPANPTAGLRHACGLVAADELGRLAAMTGTAFDQYFMRAWIEHAQSALLALRAAPSLPVAATANRLLHQDVATLGAAV